MIIHHLNCGSLCPVGGKFFAGPAGKMICHCLLIETGRELILVDTGLGTEDVKQSYSRIGLSALPLRARLDRSECAIEQVKALGHRPEDVRHILLTHLDFDHAGGAADFPHARVHLLRAEHQAATDPRRNLLARERYRDAQISSVQNWEFYEPAGGESWHGFEAVRELRGLPPEILMIPLRGHSEGHAGVAVSTGAGWLLHAGDAYFYHEEMNPEKPSCPSGLRLFQKLMAVDNETRLQNQAKLRELAKNRAAGVTVFSAHDLTEFQKASTGCLNVSAAHRGPPR